MQTSIAKKLFAVGSASAMILASLPLVASAAVHAAGSNVVSNGTVYWINASGQKQAYTSAGAFLSYGFNSWSNVVAASAEDLALPSGGFVPPMDGSLINDNGTVYLMTNGMRAGFTSAANFTGLGYSFANVIPGDTSFLASASLINSTAMAHPVGTLVNQSGTVYLMTTAGKMGIPSLSVFNSWGYSFSKVVPANSYDAAIGMNSGIMLERMAGQLNPTGTTVVTPTTGSVSVGAATTMPASSTIAADVTNGQTLVNLADFNFMGNGAVTSVVVKRTGVSADSTLSNVYLFDGANRLTDGASITSGSMATFANSAGLFTVNGSKTISVRADIAGNTAGQTVGIQLVSAMTGSTAVAGTPVSGNTHTIATASLATLALTVPSDSGDTDPGSDVLVWQGTATVSTRDVLMTRLALRQIGSIQNADINNFKLFADGIQIASSSNLDANGYVTFAMSKALTTGGHTLKVTADVIGGSSRTVEFSLRGTYDISATDTQYNSNAIVTLSTTPFDSDGFTVNPGTIVVAKATDSQSANVTVGASDVSVGKWTVTAYGEPIKVETLTVGVNTDDTDSTVTFRNVRILVNGAQVGNTTNVAAVDALASGQSYTTNFTVNPGTPATVEVRADMYDTEGTDEIAAGTLTSAQFGLILGSSNGRRQMSLGTVNVPSATVAANTLTIASGMLSIAKTANYANQTIVVPQTNYKLGSFVLTGSSTEAINLNTIEVDFTQTVGTSFDASDDITNLYVKYGNNQTAVKGTAADSNNTWSINYPLAVNESLTLEVYGTIGSTVTATNTIRADVTVTGITSQSAQTVYADVTSSNTSLDAGFQGQLITAGSGSITATADASSPVSAIVNDAQSVTTAAFKFAAVNDSYTITDLTFTIADATNVLSVNLKDGGTTVATKPGGTTVTFNGLSIAAAANTNKVLSLELVLGTTGVGAGTSGASILTTLTDATARDSSGTSAAVTESNPAGNAMYVYAAIPTVTNVALPTGTLIAGTNTIGKFTVSSNGSGIVGWKKVIFTVTSGTNATIANGTASTSLWDADTNTAVAGVSTAAGITAGAAGTVTFVATNEQQISGAKTYYLKATVGGSLVTGDTLQTYIAQPSSYVAPAAYATVAGTAASFVWSDQSASAHTESTLDWNNGYLVKNLPTDSQTLTK